MVAALIGFAAWQMGATATRSMGGAMLAFLAVAVLGLLVAIIDEVRNPRGVLVQKPPQPRSAPPPPRVKAAPAPPEPSFRGT